MDPQNEEETNEFTSKMIFRMTEGVSEAIYVIGVTKEGNIPGVTKEDLGKVKKNLKNQIYYILNSFY